MESVEPAAMVVYNTAQCRGGSSRERERQKRFHEVNLKLSQVREGGRNMGK